MFKLYVLFLSIFWSFSASAQTDTIKIYVQKDTTLCIIDDTYLDNDSYFLGIDALYNIDYIKFTGKVVKGIASFYSKNLDGTITATGEIYRNSKLSGASNNLKLNTWVRVTNLRNGKTVIVRINDRMHPAMKKKGRVIDLSRTAAKKLDFMNDGLTKVILEVIDSPKKS